MRQSAVRWPSIARGILWLGSARRWLCLQYLIGKGADPQHLAAAGFGEFQPIDSGDSDEALARNRRIELKITER